MPKSWDNRQDLNHREPFKLKTAGEETTPALARKQTHNSQSDCNGIIDFSWLKVQGDFFESSTSLAFFGPRDFSGNKESEQFWKKFGHLEILNGHEREGGKILVFFEASLNRYLYYIITRENQYEKTTFANFQKCLKLLSKIICNYQIKKLSISKVNIELNGMVWTAAESTIQEELGDNPILVTVYSGDDKVQGMYACEPSPLKTIQYGKVTLLRPNDELGTAEQQKLACKFECERPLSVLVEIHLAGRAIDALVDTGACVNVISGRLLDQLGLRQKLELYQGKARTVDGSPLAIEGTVNVRTQVGNVDTTVRYLVAEAIEVPVILGLGFMTTHNCSVDLHSYQFWTGTESSATPLKLKGSWHMDALTVAKTEVDWKEMSFKHKTDVVPDGAENLSTKQNDVTAAKEQSTEPDDTNLIVELTSGAIAGSAKDTLGAIVREFRDVFAVRDSELGATNQVYHHINTGDSRPIKLPPHRVAPGKLPDVKSEVQDMLQRGIIQPSNSPYSAPIVMVRKKDGSNRFCVDYRRLNEVTRKDAQPIPNIDQTLDALRGSKWFSSLDLASGYWQVEVAPEDRHKTAFVTPDGGLYEYKRMPFGLSNAPGTFQRLMNELFKTELHKYVLIFLDDILIYSPTLEEHADHVRRVMVTLRAANLKLKPKKCKFFQPQVEYLGHIIDQNGSRPDNKKVEAVQTWPRPTTVTGVKSFLGFCNYYRKFVKDFAQKAEPLTNLTKKYQRFSWDTKCETAFQTLKDALTDAPVLAHPDYNSPFIVDTDASNTQLGAVLSNVVDGVERPLVFASRVLSKTECQYATTKREALAVVQALKWFKPYIWGLKFIIRTDHASLKWLFRQNADGMTFRMLQKLQEFDYEFVHRAGEKHGNADGLSRQIPDEQLPGWLDGELEQLVQPEPEPCSMKEAIQRVKQSLVLRVSADPAGDAEDKASRVSSIRDEQQKDSTLALFRRWTGAEDDPNQAALSARKITREEASEHGTEMLRLWSSWDRFAYKDGVLHYRWQTAGREADKLLPVIPWGLRADALQQLHDSPVSGGHMAVEKTLDRIRQRFWWPGMRQDVERYIEVCKPCAARRTQGRKLVAELKPFVVGTRFHKVAADILGPVTLTKDTSFKYILVMTDLFTKYVVTVPLADQTASSVAQAIMENWFLRFGMPDSLHTDQGTNFCSQLLKDVCTLLGVDKTRTSAFHPQGNGQVERHNRVVADMLSKYCANNPRIWDRLVPYLTFVYNTTVHKTTGATPFSLVYGAECQYPIDLFYPRQPGAESFDDGFVDDLGQVFREAHQQARVTLGTNQRRVKDAYHKKVHGDPYREGMRVWLFCKHKAISKKFNLPWEGPYLVLERISDVTYKIAKEPVKEDRWQIVHYNRLKPYLAEAERPRREVNKAKQTVYDENTDSEATESEEDAKHETGEPRGNLTERQTSKDDSVSQSPAKGLCLEIPANPFGSLCLGDSITKRLRAHEVADDCVIRGFSGIKIDELRRRLKQSDATRIHVVALCIGTNDILSGSATPKSMWHSYEELLDDVLLKFKPSKLVVCTLPPLEGSVVQHNNLVRNFNNCLKKQLEAWRQRATPTQIEVIDVYKQFEGKNLMSRDGIHPNKKGLTTMTQLYRRACESGHMTVAMESDSEDEEQQFWLPKTATTATRLPTSDPQGTPVVADETLTPGPLLSGGSHDGTALETLQLGPSADPTGTPVEAETPRAREKRSRIPRRSFTLFPTTPQLEPPNTDTGQSRPLRNRRAPDRFGLPIPYT